LTDPDRALEHARSTAATMRAEGAYAGESGDRASEGPAPTTLENLFEWAMIDPDLREVRSTRKLGLPVTLLKRGLVRLLQQYHAELISQQTRFNVHVLGHVRRLETRIEELERIVGSREREPGTEPGPERLSE
jgi:hypothetical protein